MSEILAPAGNLECALAAINNGADAVYLGYTYFSARQSADNFDEEKLKTVLLRAHCHHVRVYVAMNTIVKESERFDFVKTLLSLWSLGVDAIILQDILLGKAIHEQYPQIVLHLSTQAGVCSVEGAKFAKECGFSRVILARETPLSEIRKITKILETEVFVQGALCTCFSGQCYFSSFIGGNSGNRGRCKQPCRKTYSYNRNGNDERSYALSLSDLSVGEDIEKLKDAGVVSFKIEGRMRRAEYVAAAVKYYRKILDKQDGVLRALSDLKRTYNRGNYTKGLAFGQDKRFLSTAIQGHIGEKVGVVKVINGKFFVESSFHPQNGDGFKILRDGKEIGGAFFEKEFGKGFYLQSKTRLKNGDGVFITTDNEVNARVLLGERRKTLKVSLSFIEGEYAVAKSGAVSLTSEERLQTADSHPLEKTELKTCFLKTDGLPFDIEFEEICLQGNIFIPKSKLNQFRRRFYEEIAQNVIGERDNCPISDFRVDGFIEKTNKTAVIATEFYDVETDVAIWKPTDFSSELPKSFQSGKFEKYIYYPAFLKEEDEKSLHRWTKEGKIDGIYVENYSGILFARENGLKIFAGTGLNLCNRLSIHELFKFENLTYYALSKELNVEELKPLLSEKAFVLSSGDLKLMDLCYCPFEKTCGKCDKKEVYELTDENGRVFPVRRYVSADGECRFEVYNNANLIGEGIKNAGKLIDCTLQKDVAGVLTAKDDTERQKQIYKQYTSGHFKRGVL